MIATKAYKVKVYDHNDAVVFVYENRWEKTNPKDKECHKYKHWKEVLTAIPTCRCHRTCSPTPGNRTN